MNANTDRPVPASGRWAPVLSPLNIPALEPDPEPEQPGPETPVDEGITDANPAPRRPRHLVLGISAAVGAVSLGALALGLSSLGSTQPAPPPLQSAAPPVVVTTTASFLAGGPCPNTVVGKVYRGNGPGGTVGAVPVIFAFQRAYYGARSGEQVRALVLPESPVSSAETIQQGINTIPASTAYCLTITEHQPTHFLVEVFERRPSGETKTYRQNVTTVDRDGRTFIDTVSNADG
ncbi:hypothetical protein ACW2Q0_20790 [Nocardia sp. R16R-3T]